MKKIIVLIAMTIIGFTAMAQKSLNDYKYILIPKTFEVLKDADKYQLNSLTKFLFNKYGYEAYFLDEELPEDLNMNRCLALTADISDKKSGMFKTKIEMILKDCFGSIVMTSKVGESRLKKYDSAYNEALRNAFQTYLQFDYSYKSKDSSQQNLITKDETDVTVSDINHKIQPEIVEDKKTEDKVLTRTSKSNVTEIDEIAKLDGEKMYYAQMINNGFQIVDATPKVIMILLNTDAKDVFIVKDKSAIVYKENGEWIYYETNGSSLKKEVVNIKF